MLGQTWRVCLFPLTVTLVLQLISAAFCQTITYNSMPFSALLGENGGVQLNGSANITSDKTFVNGSFIINGQTDVWISLPSYSGVVRLEAGSRLLLSNMGINFSLSGSLDLPSLLTPSFFEVDPAAALELRNVSVNTNCDTLSALRNNLCDRMPDQDYEICPWSLRIVNLVAQNTTTLIAQNVTLRCGFSATNSTFTYTLMGSDRPPSSDSDLETTATMTIPCVSWRVTTYGDFRNVIASHPNVQPQAFYVFILTNVTGNRSDLFSSKLLVPKNKISILITGRPDVPTQLDLRHMVGIISLSGITSDPSRVDIRDLTLVNMEYGPSSQYPLALVKAALWFLDYPRVDNIYTPSSIRVSLTRVTLVVSDTELWWWREVLESAIRSNETAVDGGSLIQYFAPGLVVDPEDVGNLQMTLVNSRVYRIDDVRLEMLVPYWEWAYGTTTWTNCSLTATPLVDTAPLLFPTRSDLLATLAPYGQNGPVQLSTVRVAQQRLDASMLTLGPTVMLPYDTQLSTSLTSSRPTLGDNLTLWGEPRGVRILDLMGLSGVITVPPYTVLTLRFLTLVNLGAGERGGAQPAVLQNYTLMFWAFNRTLLPGSGSSSSSSRRALLSSSLSSDDGGALGQVTPRPPAQLDHRLTPLGQGVDRLQRSRGGKVSQRLEPVMEHSPWPPVRRGITKGGRLRRHLLQAATNGNPGVGPSSSGGSSSSSAIPVGPFRTWLRLEEVVLYIPPLECQLLYELVTSNRTSLAVSPDVVDWLRGVLATAQVTRTTSTVITFSFLTWMGVEAVDVTISSLVNAAVTSLQPIGSIFVSGPPRVPPPASSPPPWSPGLAVPPPATIYPLPSASKNTASIGFPPSSGPGGAAVVVHSDIHVESVNPASSVVGPAVGSVAGLLLLCSVFTFAVMYVRHRRRLSQAADPSKAKDLGVAVDGGAGDEGQTPSRNANGCSSPMEPPKATIQPPPPPGPDAETAAAASAPPAGQGPGGRKDAAQPAIQPVTEEDMHRDDGPPAAAAAGSSGKPPAFPPQRPPRQRRSRESNIASGRGQGTRRSRPVEGIGSAANAGRQGIPGHSQPSKQQQQHARGSGSAASGSSGGIASDTVPSDPRTELYAALAAFQSEFGEQQRQITIISQLGAGAHGVVYRAEWRGLEVAAKTLLFQAFLGSNGDEGGNSLREQAMLEAAIATTLFHPNVINTYSYDIKPLRMCPAPTSSTHSSRAETVVSSEGGSIMDWKLYIIQEYCDGGTLKDALDGSRFTNPETGMSYTETAVRVAIEIASGMSYIHNRNIIHGDLKPANILLRSNSSSPYGYTVKIADFGLALKLKAGESHISNIRRGTPFYIASELVEDGRATTASDLYSFGVILWELLHGSTVARRLPLRRRVPNLPAEFYTWPPDCPPAYRDLANACLSSNPASRPRFNQALEALTGVLQLLLEAKPQEQRRRQEEQEKRRRLAATEAAAKATEQQAQGKGQGHEQEHAENLGAQYAQEKVAAAADCCAASGEAVKQSPSVLRSFSFAVAVRQTEVLYHKDHLQDCKDQPDGTDSEGRKGIGGPSGSTARQGGAGNGATVLPNGGGIAVVGKRSEAMDAATGAAAATADHQGAAGITPMMTAESSATAPACTPQHPEQPPGNGGAFPRPRHAEQAPAGTEAPGATLAEGTLAAAARGVGPAVQPQEHGPYKVPFGGARPLQLPRLARAAFADAVAAAGPEASVAVSSLAVAYHGEGGDFPPAGGDGKPASDAVAQSGQPTGGVPHSHQEQRTSRSVDADGPLGDGTRVSGGMFPAAGTAFGPIAIGNARKASWDAALYANHPDNDHADSVHSSEHSDTDQGAAGIGVRREAPPLSSMPGASSSATTHPRPGAPLTAAAAAAVLAALAASMNNTTTLDPDTAGMLDSCLGSTEAHAMDRGLMLDLMPALSNQVNDLKMPQQAQGAVTLGG
ncbi:hypothetical protein VOLCADRAFT_104447 [Volvox carteri f. nagariensis]|uniref:Protein kinase domain-containing protein n=1 Tax=Volvox carteri f. nagariensis TaxID=3068 RepID=D8TTP0_VOLCA|nr:uncharacterized protein VOLCADRAFT_104447 [Volvox carteri f. nagariensis]EFJ49343.1 hypothetical protein VOLCADRAFT_104447 [Volvox carteri f. nagariensis]|eukprot:XP_002949791.1 hypothetical protein VOLCADRAFT_104447 [Volvox carteri f. nagariensis]